MTMGNDSVLILVFLSILSVSLSTTISSGICPLETNSSCSCTSYLFGLELECQANDARVSIIVGYNGKAVIDCHDTNLDTFDFDSLSQINFCKIFRKNISNCPLSLKQSKDIVFQKFCLTTAKTLFIEASGPISRVQFEGLHDLESLILTSNDLRELPEDTFDDLTFLKSLNLNSNILKLGINMFSSLRNLNSLNLRNTSLYNLPPGVFRSQRQLQDLYLSNNNLSNLTKASFEGLISLRRLHLRSNKIVVLPSDVFSHMIYLEYIDVSENYFQSLPEGLLAANKHLTVFELSDNHVPLKKFPSKLLANLPRLRTVNLRCGLEEIPEDLFANSTNIEHIDISRNNITTLPPGLFADLLHLSDLELSQNQLNVLPDRLLSKTKSLGNLRVSHNHLVSISNETFSGLINLREVHIDNNNLRKIHDGAFARNQELTHIYLENNRLQFIAITSFINLEKLQVLNMTNNSIEAVNFDAFDSSFSDTTGRNFSKYSAFLDLSQNKIQRLQDSVLSFLNESRTALALSGNPWMCDCAAQSLVSFVQQKHRVIPDIDQIKCADGRRVLHLSASTICSSNNNLIIAGCSLLATAGLLAAAYFKFRQEIKVWLYAQGMCLWFVSEEDLDKDKKYDAFISYSHKDEDFVTECLLPELESGPNPFKICIHVRDWVVGEFIPYQIVQSVSDSRRTIIVLSANFIESVWGRMEFRAAHTAALTERRARVIVVIYGDIGNIDMLDSELKAYLQMNTYVKWGDRWFWKKLRYAMPHSSRLSIADDFELGPVRSSLRM